VTPGKPGDCPVWLAFLRQATGDDKEFVRFLRQWCGYSLTGITREHSLLFVYGPGGNGKSVFLNTVSGILGGYACTAAMDTFVSSSGDRHPADLAMLRGARLVTATETEEGRAWAESRIKQLTGGDPISARFMRQDFFTFTPQFKLVIAGNHKPTLRNVDEAARRRFNIGPFLHTPPQPDRQLEAKLQAEWPGILAWMIEGCLDWQANGLVRPKVVVDATADYFDAQDIIGRWLAERCLIDPQLQEKPGRLSADCRAWAAENGETSPTPPQFRSAIERTRGIRYVTIQGTQHVRGIGFQAAPDRRQARDDDDA
jgi:putative DNA primase/helicase